MDDRPLCVLSGRGLCDGLITRPEESYRLWCFLVYNLGTSRIRRLKLIKGCKFRIEDEEEEEETLIIEIFSKYPSFVWIFAAQYA